MVCQRKPGEDELTFLRRKEVAFGLWQGDMLERMQGDETLIARLEEENRRLLTALDLLKNNSEMATALAANTLNGVAPIDFAKDLAPFKNIMAHYFGPEKKGRKK